MSGPLVVVGDALLDVDLIGTASRLSPDAPAPVVDEIAEHDRPGGAALAAVLAASGGREVVLIAPVADDEGGARLRAALAGRVELVAVPLDGPTPVKKRVRVSGQSLLRLDTGGSTGRPGPLPSAARAALGRASGVLVADYGRGLTAREDVREALTEVAHRVPLVWDPHPRGSAPVAAARLVTPNADEAARASGVEISGNGLAAVSARADALVTQWGVGAVAVTLGERGALLSYGEGAPMLVPARAVSGDTCGAGDRFASAAAVLLADGAVLAEAVSGAVTAASAFVEAGGASSWDREPVGAPTQDRRESIEDVRRRGGTVVATGGCFDLLHAGHVATLRAARGLGDALVVTINSDASVRRLKGPSRPLVAAEDRARVLEALECVDVVVVFDEDTPERVLSELRPDVWAKGGDYAGVDLPEAPLLRSWGGQAVVLPYLDGRSTTALVAKAKDPRPADSPGGTHERRGDHPDRRGRTDHDLPRSKENSA